MGVDFVTTCTPTFVKGWDIGLADIQTADLFTDLPCEAARTYRAAAEAGATVAVGDTVFLRPCGAAVSVVKGRTSVGLIAKPPSTLVERLGAAGIATGTVSKMHRRSGGFDVRAN